MAEQTQEFIRVPCKFTAKWVDPAGYFVNRLFLRMRDKGELWGVKCPQCGAVWFPPEPVCGKCKIEIKDEDQNWLKLGNQGTLLLAYHVTGSREQDPITGWHPDGQVFGPLGFVRPDGGNEYTLLVHAIDEPDVNKLKPGMRVEAVWKPQAERNGSMQDIKFFRVVEDK